jgi:hypothetical protein
MIAGADGLAAAGITYYHFLSSSRTDLWFMRWRNVLSWQYKMWKLPLLLCASSVEKRAENGREMEKNGRKTDAGAAVMSGGGQAAAGEL